MLVGILLAAGLSQSDAADAEGTITKIEVRQLSPEAVAQQISDQLAKILVPVPQASGASQPKHALDYLTYWTKPVGTEVAGLCKTDKIVLDFQATDSVDVGAKTPVQLSGLVADTWYRFLIVPEAFARGEMSAEDRRALRGRCAALIPDATEFFYADSEYSAWLGETVFRAVVRELKSSDGVARFKCSPQTPIEECIQLLSRAKYQGLAGVQDCTARDVNRKGACLVLWTATVGLAVYYTGEPNDLSVDHADVRQPTYIFDDFQDD